VAASGAEEWAAGSGAEAEAGPAAWIDRTVMEEISSRITNRTSSEQEMAPQYEAEMTDPERYL
jgi:hypothetical protein